ncbi:MAG TPA: cupin domain-containing protein [Chloroflexota bacterium]|nr:cupin domain-containing protein [Chloroflexota bacterium]
MANGTQWHEPTGEQPAGLLTYRPPKSPYERFMEEEGIPIVTGIGVYDTRELNLGPWKRLGGKGAFLNLDGLEGVKGMFVVEVPPGGALNPERHMYDEFFLVVEGRGSTEVWREGDKKRQVFEWQPGTLFMAPINAWHQLVNATNSPALLIASNNAPPIMNIYQSRSFIFDNPYDFRDRYDMGEDFFKPKTDLEADEVRGRAAMRSNVFPDIKNCALPLDNQRAPGYRRIQPYFSGFLRDAATGGFIAEYPSGRYSKAHYHLSGAVLVCLKGAGYTFNWPVELGPQPWQAGKGDQVKIQEYKDGGLVAAAPGGGSWFHQHFAVSKEPFRVINYWGGPVAHWGGIFDEPGAGEVKAGNLFGIHEGGRTIMYWEEDPYIREYYQQRLKEVGVEFTMPESTFQPPAKGTAPAEMAVPHHH